METAKYRNDLARLVEEVTPLAVEVRRRIHRRPELSHREFRTSELIGSVLGKEGVVIRGRDGRTGLTAEVGSDGPVVAFRSDLDALPIRERTGLPFTSEITGIMHACGHDMHAAIGTGIAVVLHRLAELPGRARFIFQPAEESFPGGAVEMVEEGAVEGARAVFAFHVAPDLEPGRIGITTGPITSSSDRFFISVEGPGGHTARPHETVDTVYAASRTVAELPALLERSVDARKPLSVVFGTIHGGNADNVIPTEVELSGTCRLLHRDLWEQMPHLFQTLIEQIVAPTGAKAMVHYQRGIPPVVNDAAVIAELEIAACEIAGRNVVADTEASMGAEDFSRYLEHAPGALIRLGAQKPGRRLDLHSASFDAAEEAIPMGILVGAAGLLRLMNPRT